MSGVPQSDRESRHLLLGTLDRTVPRHDDSHVVAERCQGFRQTAGHIAETAYLGEGIRLGGCEQDLHWNLGVDMRPGLKPAFGTSFLETNSERNRLIDPVGAFAKDFSFDVHAEGDAAHSARSPPFRASHSSAVGPRPRPMAAWRSLAPRGDGRVLSPAPAAVGSPREGNAQGVGRD